MKQINKSLQIHKLLSLTVSATYFVCNIQRNLRFELGHLWQRYTHRVLQKIQMKLILSWVWAERAVFGRAKTALKFKYEIEIGQQIFHSMYGAGYKLEK